MQSAMPFSFQSTIIVEILYKSNFNHLQDDSGSKQFF